MADRPHTVLQVIAARAAAADRAGRPLTWRDGPPPWWPRTFRAGCDHIHPNDPPPVAALLSMPSIVRCADCTREAVAATVEADPDRCDLCRQQSSTFHGVSMSRGPVLIVGNVCPACLDYLQEDPDA
jgi:hypothetical protein